MHIRGSSRWSIAGIAVFAAATTVGCGNKSPVAQTSRGVMEEQPAPTKTENAQITRRSADVPDVTDPKEVIVYLKAGSVWLRKANGSEEPFQLTGRSSDAPDQSPSLNPKSETLLYAAIVDGVYRVHTMSLDEMLPKVIGSPKPGPDDQPAWAPDGDRIAYMSGNPEERRDLYIYTVSKDKDELVLEGKDERPALVGMPAWSPDGRTIAMVSDRRHGKGALIWLVDVRTKRIRRLTPPRPGAWFLRDRDPCFSPDGKRIAFASNRHVNSADDVEDYDIYTIAADGSGLTRLTSDPKVATDPVYSSDGKRIYFVSTRDSTQVYESEIYVMAAGGGRQKRITRDERPQNRAPSSGRME